jgi:hypothetical protein
VCREGRGVGGGVPGGGQGRGEADLCLQEFDWRQLLPRARNRQPDERDHGHGTFVGLPPPCKRCRWSPL